jgi:hypothetical protein
VGKFHTSVWVGLVVFAFIFFSSGATYSQLNRERTALSRLQAGKWESANRLLRTALLKDSLNVEATYVLARWYFATGNPAFHIDSASLYANRTIALLNKLSLRDRERLAKFPVDSAILYTLRQRIDSAAFERAKKINTEDGYNFFLRSYHWSLQVPMAIELRDEVAFLEALKVNTYQSFQDYLARYPESLHAQAASDRYEKLLFEDKTRDKRLNSYRQFLKQYPASPYAGEALRNIFEIATAASGPDDFLLFLNEYPNGHYAALARDILFHLLKEDPSPDLPAALLTDSLKHVLTLDDHYWIPFLKNNLFGFMDATGTEMLPPRFQAIREEYKCRPVKDDILFLPDGYFSRSGKKLASPEVELESIGLGFLIKTDGTCHQLIHKSGRVIIAGCYDDYYTVGNHFIAAEREGAITLFTLAGRALPVSIITHAEEMEGLVILTRSGKKVINTIAQLGAMADGHPFQDELVFDEIRVVDKGMLLVRISGMEGILSDQLQFIVPLDKHTLTKTPFGLIEKKFQLVRVRGLSDELENKTWGRVYFHREWLVLQEGGQQQLFHIPTRTMMERALDTVWFEHRLAFAAKGPNRKVYITANKIIELQADSKIQFIPSRDSVQYFYTESKKKRSLFSLHTGNAVFTTDYDLLESLEMGYFIVTNGSKKGVLDALGKVVVPVEMDVIIQNNQRQLSLLKDKKFGLFDMASGKLIKPVYDRNVLLLDHLNVAVFKNGLYAVMALDGKMLTDFEYAEIQPWRDSLVWVKYNLQWRLVNYFQKKVILDRIRDFTYLKNAGDEKIIRIHRENYYGIISSRWGTVIPPTFTAITNLGTLEEPLYFTEKYIEEAGIYIVVYYNQRGELIRRHAYEEEEYERIVCDDR